jgi:hypothetical protein
MATRGHGPGAGREQPEGRGARAGLPGLAPAGTHARATGDRTAPGASRVRSALAPGGPVSSGRVFSGRAWRSPVSAEGARPVSAEGVGQARGRPAAAAIRSRGCGPCCAAAVQRGG